MEFLMTSTINQVAIDHALLEKHPQIVQLLSQANQN